MPNMDDVDFNGLDHLNQSDEPGFSCQVFNSDPITNTELNSIPLAPQLPPGTGLQDLLDQFPLPSDPNSSASSASQPVSTFIQVAQAIHHKIKEPQTTPLAEEVIPNAQ